MPRQICVQQRVDGAAFTHFQITVRDTSVRVAFQQDRGFAVTQLGMRQVTNRIIA